MKQGLKIVFEDDWLIVVEKPSGLLTMSTGKGHEVTAYSMLYDYVCEGSGHKRNTPQPRIFIVHRLDRDTSGLLVFAKDEETKLALQENWEEAVQERRYIAILEGQIDDDEGYIETWMYENPRSLMVHCYDLRNDDTPEKPPRKDWKYASSHCKKLKDLSIDGKAYTAVEFNLETGRRNQIRVHSQHIGHPIAGDKKYGALTNPYGRLALHAQGLSFIHPWTGKTMRFSAKLPRNLYI